MGEVRGAAEATLGSDVLARQEGCDSGLVESVGGVDAIPADVRCWIRTRRRHGQVHEFVLKHACVAACHFLVEVVGSSYSTACLQWRCDICESQINSKLD